MLPWSASFFDNVPVRTATFVAPSSQPGKRRRSCDDAAQNLATCPCEPLRTRKSYVHVVNMDQEGRFCSVSHPSPPTTVIRCSVCRCVWEKNSFLATDSELLSAEGSVKKCASLSPSLSFTKHVSIDFPDDSPETNAWQNRVIFEFSLLHQDHPLSDCRINLALTSLPHSGSASIHP